MTADRTDGDPSVTRLACREAAINIALLERGDHESWGDAVSHALWAIRNAHADRFWPDPLEDCFELAEILHRARKLDPDSVGKLPVTIALLKALFSMLCLANVEHRVPHASYIFAFAFGSRRRQWPSRNSTPTNGLTFISTRLERRLTGSLFGPLDVT